MDDAGSDQLLTRISPRGLQCLALVGLGLELKHIARVLNMEPGSVDTALKRAAKSTGISGRKQLAGLLRRHHPEVIQSTIQRLGQTEKSLATMLLSDPAGPADAAVGTQQVTFLALPIPTAERPWNDLPGWARRLWAVIIAAGFLVAAWALVSVARNLLVAAPRPVELGVEASHA